MRESLRLSKIRIHAAHAADRDRGLRCFASITIDDAWRVNELVVRRTRDGKIVVTFPTRRNSAGIEHTVFLPVEPAMRAKIEAVVLEEARRGGWLQ